ncbi:thioredoxin family protein [Halalkalicoccus ordinarius]|uniref:thioredoxin family protein n=1 Tax=Halalkalicoccus ordinarius TaxID=3116651 RepID=UPI00300F6540
MTLETMEPNPTWDPVAHEATLEPFEERADELTIHVWGADWCGDCRSVLPDFAAALDAAGVPEESIHQYEVEKLEDGSKEGPKVEEYGVEYIPTIVVERNGEKVARFVEKEPIPVAEFLAEQLNEIEAGPETGASV